ncbi:hypothetical protein GQ42DRAFT_175963 [Ramicandelaber brevisporus]|nr:hypothetical protein GQ42DRAFT_181416 [Ramicandelaber brevisporus]KAI8874168.1 hypothetical protein GQ42DRAFT_175963 [Ramicandelaber brevisporus]
MKFSVVSVAIAALLAAASSAVQAANSSFSKLDQPCLNVRQHVSQCGECTKITSFEGGYDALVIDGKTISLWNNDNCSDQPHHTFVVSFKGCDTTGWKSVKLNC